MNEFSSPSVSEGHKNLSLKGLLKSHLRSFLDTVVMDCPSLPQYLQICTPGRLHDCRQRPSNDADFKLNAIRKSIRSVKRALTPWDIIVPVSLFLHCLPADKALKNECDRRHEAWAKEISAFLFCGAGGVVFGRPVLRSVRSRFCILSESYHFRYCCTGL